MLTVGSPTKEMDQSFLHSEYLSAESTESRPPDGVSMYTICTSSAVITEVCDLHLLDVHVYTYVLVHHTIVCDL